MPGKKNDSVNDGQIIQTSMGGRIEISRSAQGLTQAQLASRLGVLTKTIGNWESDRSEPRINKLVTLTGILHVSVLWLMTGVESDSDNTEPKEYETAALASKVNQLLSHHQQTSTLILELQSEVNRLQSQIDMGGMEITRP